MESNKSGPYVLVNGEKTDADLWLAELDEEIEDKFDQYMLIQAIGEEAEKELARREREEQRKKRKEESDRCFNELMKAFGPIGYPPSVKGSSSS